jgi:hypothetical protein
MNIIGAKFDNSSMDFERLISNPMYSNALFIFNDNQSEHNLSKRGGGNAKIRPYNMFSGMIVPRSAGVPTGFNREGYQALYQGKTDIDRSFDEIKTLLSTGNYNTIVYSIDNYNDPLLGRGLFVISDDVKRYITKRILEFGFGGNYFFQSGNYGISVPIVITEDIINFYN